MQTAPRKFIALTALVFAVFAAGCSTERPTSTPTHSETPEYATVPFSDKDYQILEEEKAQFRSDLEWAKEDFERKMETPAAELGMTEVEKKTILLQYKSMIDEAEAKLAEK